MHGNVPKSKRHQPGDGMENLSVGAVCSPLFVSLSRREGICVVCVRPIHLWAGDVFASEY